jgi:hypothetical protein
VLNEPLALHDVQDAEALCARVIERSGLSLSYHDAEDLLAYLVATAWALSLVYDRGDPQYPSGFSTYATRTLGLRLIDWQRSRFGRTKWKFSATSSINAGYRGRTIERERPALVSLDDPEQDRVGSTLVRSSLDGDERGFAAHMRMLAKRGRRPGRRDDYMGDDAA